MAKRLHANKRACLKQGKTHNKRACVKSPRKQCLKPYKPHPVQNKAGRKVSKNHNIKHAKNNLQKLVKGIVSNKLIFFFFFFFFFYKSSSIKHKFMQFTMMVRFHRSPASRQQQSSEKPQILFYDETEQLSVHISAKVQRIKVIYNV